MAEEQKVVVKSYDSLAFKKTWVSRVKSMWAGAAVGLAAGVAIGLLAPFIPAIAGFTAFEAAVAAIPASVAAFSTSVMIMGSLVGAMVGASSGAVCAVAEEMERRGTEKEQATSGKTSVVKADLPEIKTSEKREYRYFNSKIMAAFAAFGAVAGAVIVASGLAASGGALAMPALVPVLGGLATNPAAVASYTIGVMALGSSLFGVNFPEMVNSTQNYIGKVLNGKALGTSWEKKPNGTYNTKVSSISANTTGTVFVEERTATSHVSKLGDREAFSTYSDMVVKSSANSKAGEQIHHK